MIRTLAAVLATSTCIIAMATPAAAQARDYNIPAGSLRSALDAFARQSGEQVVYRGDEIGSARSAGVQGAHSADEALAAILAGSGFAARKDRGGAIAIVKVGNGVDTSASNDEPSSDIVVTGTNIRGVNPASPVSTYTQEDIRKTGATTVGEFFQRLPSNFGGLSPLTSVAESPGVGSTGGVDAVDLRGLGVGTTLVLLNGRPLAPTASGMTPDISLLPLGALARVDVMTDGASAVYGSDAIGGVVNFIMKDRFEGAETAISGGTVTDGNHSQITAQQLLGHSWGSGSALLSVGYAHQSALTSADRPYANGAGLFDLIPEQTRLNLFLNAEQNITSSISLFGDFFYSKNRTRTNDAILIGTATYPLNSLGVQATYTGTAGVDVALPNSWKLELATTYSRATDDQNGVIFAGTVGHPTVINRVSKDYDVTAKMDGSLLHLPGGDLKFAIGGGVTWEHYLFYDNGSSMANLGRQTQYGYGEIFVPIIGSGQHIPGINRLEVSIAARYSHYSDFGNNTSPKYTLLWAPVSYLKLRATYSESFKAPFLSQLAPANAYWEIVSPGVLPSIGPIASFLHLPATSYFLYAGGSNLNIGPETAKNKTIGFDFSPPILPGLKISATYFDINYKDKIVAPNTNSVSASPAPYASLFNASPTLAEITALTSRIPEGYIAPGFDASSPSVILSSIAGILDFRYQNFSATKVAGVDVDVSYKRGAYGIGTQLTVLSKYNNQVIQTSQPVSVLNTFGQPVKWRDRSWVGYDNGPLSGQLSMNFIGSYSNPVTTPASTIASWTTVDFAGSYTFPEQHGFLKGFQVSLSIQNMFNIAPPYAKDGTAGAVSVPIAIGYDPTNANPLGRFISVELRKRW